MMSLECKILSSPEQIKIFAQNYNRISKSSLLVYKHLLEEQLFGVFQQGKMVAGFAVNLTPPFQYLQCVPKEYFAHHPMLSKLKDDEVVEMAGFWIDKNLIKSFIIRSFIYYLFVREVYRTGKKYVLGGTFVEKLREIHRGALPYDIYAGRRDFDGINKHFWIYYCGRLEFVFRYPYNVLRVFVNERLLNRFKSNSKPIMKSRNFNE